MQVPRSLLPQVTSATHTDSLMLQSSSSSLRKPSGHVHTRAVPLMVLHKPSSEYSCTQGLKSALPHRSLNPHCEFSLPSQPAILSWPSGQVSHAEHPRSAKSEGAWLSYSPSDTRSKAPWQTVRLEHTLSAVSVSGSDWYCNTWLQSVRSSHCLSESRVHEVFSYCLPMVHAVVLKQTRSVDEVAATDSYSRWLISLQVVSLWHCRS